MKLFIAAFLLSFTLLSCSDYGKKLSFDNNSLYYTKNVTQEQAQKLGNYLVEQNFFSKDSKGVSVQLDKSKDTFLFRFVVKDSFVNNPAYIQTCQGIPSALSSGVFDNSPVIVHFCDDHLKTKRIVRGQL